MRVEIIPSRKSTPESPQYVCRVWCNGRCVVSCMGSTPDEAKQLGMAEYHEADRQKMEEHQANWQKRRDNYLWGSYRI